MKNRRNAFVGFLCVMLAGCAQHYYNPTPHVLPPNVTSIAVRPFTNQSKQFGIDHELTVAVTNAFIRDGRYQIASEEEAKGVLIGDITRYIRTPLAYDSSHVATQVKLWVLVDISFYDKSRQQTLWQEKNLQAQITYNRPSTNQAGSMTIVDAERQMWDQLAKDISTRTFEGFGTVTGTSEKMVPKGSYGQATPAPPTQP